MNKFEITLENEIALLERYSLDPTELFTLKLILIAQEEDDESLLIRYIPLVPSFRNLLISLQQKSIILKSYKIPNSGERFIVSDVDINKNFIKNIHRASFDLGKELYEHYPQFATINGNVVPIRAVSKKFNTLEDAFRFYGKTIKWNQELHSKIIELLDWATNNTSFINCSLASFIIDQKWRDIEALKNGDNVNINFDSVRMI